MSDAWLAHHGAKGMKWGIRRYQNLDGSLTEEGKKRYAREVKSNSYKAKDKRLKDEDLNNPEAWVTKDYQANVKAANAGKQMTNELANLEKATRSKKENPRLNLDDMTDADLQKLINRERLERQYNDMFNSKEVSQGREAVQDTLAIAGATLGVVSSALSIALAIRELKGKA